MGEPVQCGFLADTRSADGHAVQDLSHFCQQFWTGDDGAYSITGKAISFGEAIELDQSLRPIVALEQTMRW